MVLPDGSLRSDVRSVRDALTVESINTLFCLDDGQTDLLTRVETSLDDAWKVDEWTVTDNADGGRLSSQGRAVYISLLSKSYFRTCDDVRVAFESFKALERIFLSHQKGAPLHLLSSPTLTGLVHMQMNLPRGAAYEPVSDEVLTLLSQHTTQSRTQVLTLPDVNKISEFHYYDGRFMYAAGAFYELPAGQPTRDTVSEFIPYSVGWYRVAAQVPSDWAHVGILPTRNPTPDDGRGKWLWPDNPLFTFDDVWVTEPELRLAIKHNWRVEVKERLLWPDKNARPLRAWQESIVAMRDEAARTLSEPVRGHVRRALQGFLYNAVGSMAVRDERQSVDLSPAQFIADRRDFTPDVRATLTPLDNGKFRVIKPRQKSPFRARLARYEWSAYIWARARVMLTERMLSVPRSSILGCRTDAVYLTEKPNWTDTGYCGQFVCKGFLSGKLTAPRTSEDLIKLKARAEKRGVDNG
jgi:hypothetical protein